MRKKMETELMVTQQELDDYKILDKKARRAARIALVKWYNLLMKKNRIKYFSVCEDEVIFYEHYFSAGYQWDGYEDIPGETLNYDCLLVPENELDAFLEKKFLKKLEEEEEQKRKLEECELERKRVLADQKEKEKYELYLSLKEEYGSK